MTPAFVFLAILAGVSIALKEMAFEKGRQRRQHHYRHNVLSSDAWKRKRSLVLKRDGWRCVHCGARASQVHHRKYARVNIGREPIEWLESVCTRCHKERHT